MRSYCWNWPEEMETVVCPDCLKKYSQVEIILEKRDVRIEYTPIISTSVQDKDTIYIRKWFCNCGRLLAEETEKRGRISNPRLAFNPKWMINRSTFG